MNTLSTVLFYNLTLLLTLALIYTVFQKKAGLKNGIYQVVMGVVIGMSGMFIMFTGYHVSTGAIFDARTILMGVSGLFFGIVPTLIGGVMMAVYRALMGGPGVVAAILAIITSGLIGVLWKHYRLEKLLKDNSVHNLEFYLFGLVVHIAMLLCTFALPQELIFKTFSLIAVPALVLYPIGTYVMCVLLKNQNLKNHLMEEIKDREKRLNNIIEGTNAGTWEWNVQTGEQKINERWAEIIGYSMKELEPVNIETWKKHCHPEDLTASNEVLAQVFQKKKRYYDLEFRMRHKEGHWVWIGSKGRVNSWTSQGKPLVISGTHFDVTKNKNNEALLREKETRLIEAQRIGNFGNWEYDMGDRTYWGSREALGIFGIFEEERLFTREEVSEYFSVNIRKAIKRAVEELKAGEIEKDLEFRIERQSDGKERILYAKSRVEYDAAGHPMKVVGIVQDITEKFETQLELKKSEERFRIMFEEAPLGIGLFDLKTGKAKQINKKFMEITGRTSDEFNELDWMELSHPEDMQENNALREKVFAGEIEGFNMKKRYLKKDGTIIWINLTIALLDSLEEQDPRELCMIEDITEKVKREEEILYLSCHDVLTGLFNRMFFEEEKKRLDTARQLPLSVIIADLDGLKLINDGFGYASGDRLLVESAKIFRTCCRSEDIISRIGGDEFCIILPKTTGEMARDMVKRIHALCDETSVEIGSRSVKVSISVGYDTKLYPEESLSATIANAENSMRRRKLLERKSVRSDLMSSIKATMLEKSHETAEHADRLVQFSRAIGEKLNFTENNLFELELAAMLHDIGKMSIEQKILEKQEKLTEEEWAEIKKHPEAGYRIAQATSELMPVSEYILSHHERWDGKGYPQGLKGEEIPLIARIINVVDSYDAMTSERTYGRPFTKNEAIHELKECAGSQFDPMLIQVFIEQVLIETNKD